MHVDISLSSLHSTICLGSKEAELDFIKKKNLLVPTCCRERMDTVRLSYFVGPQGKPLQESDVRVSLHARHNRKPSSELDPECIEATWLKKVAELGPRLFNGSKFRLHELAAANDGTENDHDSRTLTLSLGITNYMESLGTTTCVDRYVSHHRVDLGTSEVEVESHLAMALGVECLLVTSDEKCVLFRRSKNVATHAGWMCCPGGHPEPKNLCTEQFSSNDEAAQHFTDTIRAEAVVHELFDSAICEVVDEIGIDRSTLQNKGLIAVVHSLLDLKPDLIFLVSTSLTSERVAEIHNKRLCAEAYESDEGSLMMIPIDDVASATSNVTPPSVACLLLGHQVLRGPM